MVVDGKGQIFEDRRKKEDRRKDKTAPVKDERRKTAQNRKAKSAKEVV